MTLSEEAAILTGVVTVEDAEPLTRRLLASTPPPVVHLADCTHLHTAALQALMIARPVIASLPTEAFLARWIVPLLAPSEVPAVPAQEAS